MNNKKLHSLIGGLWAANLTVCLLVAGLITWFNTPVIVRANLPATVLPVQRELATNAPKPSITPVPPPTQRPTITPWPTPSPGPSVTPMPFLPSNMVEIGKSVEDRPLEVYRFGRGPVRKLIVGGIHGGWEWNTVELVNKLIAYLNDHPERIPEDTSLFLLPVLNPDGLARDLGVEGRANANGVDLNRNWPYNWRSSWSREGCWKWLQLSGGEFGGSELEVQNLIAYIDKIKPAALINYHSAALGIFPGGRPDFPPSIKLAEAIAAVSDYPYPPLDTGCDYTGNLTDWAANTRSIPAVDIELTNHTDIDFEQNLKVLQAFLDWRP